MSLTRSRRRWPPNGRHASRPRRATSAEALIAHCKLLIAKLRRERYGQSSERGRRLLNQLELQLEELEASAAEDEEGAG
jgi:transposase